MVRIDDLDTPRVVAGVDSEILCTLEAFGLHWDGEVIYQSRHHDDHQDALLSLSGKGLIYPCTCSRKTTGNKAYPGTCRSNRDNPSPPSSQHSLRVITDDKEIEFHDKHQGLIRQNLQQESGDFIVSRADGIIAYHLAVVVDDDKENITEVVRGSDLLDSTPKQIYLRNLLGLQQPDYYHLPVVTDKTGQKLSKRNGAIQLNKNGIQESLFKALTLLGQTPEAQLNDASPEEIIRWAVEHWNINKVPVERFIRFI